MTMIPLGLASKTIKFLMFAFNLLFVITGIALVSIGAAFHAAFYQYHHFLDDSFFSVSSLFIAVGSIIFIIALLGCCGSGRESYCLIVTFCMFLVGIFLLEIIGGTMGYVMRSSVKSIAQHKMKDTMYKYNNSTEITFVWDELQKGFNCCGINNGTDWTELIGYPDIPTSCCDHTIGSMGFTNCTSLSPDYHHIGCIEAFACFAEKHAGKIAGIGIGFGIIQLIGIFLSAYLANSIKNSYQTM